MQHASTASRLRSQLSSIVIGLSDLIKALPVRRFERFSPGVVVFAPEFYFAEPSPDQRATQFALKRKYEVFLEILRIMLRGAPHELARQLDEADKRFRDWLELNCSWSVTPSPIENANNAQSAAQQLEKILGVLESTITNDLILVPDTNSLLSAADPTEYRRVIGQDSFIFMLLPAVLGELDHLKIEHRNPEVREKARKIIVRIKGWRNQGSLALGVTVDKSIIVKTCHSEPDMSKSLSWLDANNRDDRIVASVLALAAEHPCARIILMSGDINLLNKADAALIQTIERP